MSRKRAPEPAADGPALPPPETLFADLAGAQGIVAAVSGGPDSTALMLLLSRWTDRPPTLVVTVDHGLRPEAAEEAALVARNAARLKMPCRTLRPPTGHEGGNLQAWARDMRYACLAAAAREAGADTVVTAHHRDDQAETFLLRLARGSGVYGLAAMAVETRLGELRLVRPLLSVARCALTALVEEEGLEFALDPSNDDTRFDRVAMRGLMPDLARQGLTAERLAATAGRLARAADALDGLASALIAGNFSVDGCGTIAGTPAALAGAHEEIALRALARLIAAAGGAHYTPPLDRVEALLAAIRSTGNFRRTAHGAVVALTAGRLTIAREFGRHGLSFVNAAGGASVIWDRRFEVAPSGRAAVGDALEIGPLGFAHRRLRGAAVRRREIATLPGLYSAGPGRERSLVAAPTGIVVADDGPALAEFSAACVVGARLGLPGATV